MHVSSNATLWPLTGVIHNFVIAATAVALKHNMNYTIE